MSASAAYLLLLVAAGLLSRKGVGGPDSQKKTRLIVYRTCEGFFERVFAHMLLLR